jgi:hypothetical protein
MSESIFGDLDIASAADNPFGVDEGIHPCIVSDVKVGRNKDDNKTGLTLVYTVTEGAAEGNTAQEWKTLKEDGVDPQSPAGRRAASFVKMRLLELGIPEDRINSVKPEDLKGIEGFLICGAPQSNGFPTVRSFSRTNPNNVGDVNATQAAVDSNPFDTTT